MTEQSNFTQFHPLLTLFNAMSYQEQVKALAYVRTLLDAPVGLQLVTPDNSGGAS